MKIGGRAKKRAVLGCVAFPFLLFWLAVGDSLYRNILLKRFERDFAALPHPAQSQFLARGKAVASYGNGREGEFFIAELRRYSGNPKSIRDFYGSARISVPYDANGDTRYFKNGAQTVAIEFLPSPLPKNYRYQYGYGTNSSEIDLSHLAERTNLYIVSS